MHSYLDTNLPKFHRWLLASVLLGLSILLIFYLGYALSVVVFPYPLDYGEGPILDQALRFTQGERIYQSIDLNPPYVVTNYPPLYVVSVALLVKLFGPSLLYGRLISFLSILVAALCLGGVVHNLTRRVLPAVFGVLLFLAMPAIFYWSPLQRIDMLGLAFGLAALYVITLEGLTWRKTAVTALLLLMAIFTRQTYGLAVPLAVIGSLWLRDRRQSGLFVLLMGCGGLVVLGAMTVLTQGRFIVNTVTSNINIYTFDVLFYFLRQYFMWILPMVLLVFIGLPGMIKRYTPLGLPMLYLLGGFLVSLTVGKHGSSLNYFLEISAALALFVALLLDQNLQSGENARRAHRTIFLGVLLLQVLWLMFFNVVYTIGYVGTMASSRSEYQQLEAIVADASGMVLADEYLGLLPLQGYPLRFQPFEYTQLSLVGQWDQTPLVDAILQQQFPVIFTAYMDVDYPPWTPEMIAAIEDNYRVDKTLLKVRVYVPRTP